MGTERREIEEMLATLLTETGVSLRGSAAGLIQFAGLLAGRLAEHVGAPDYEEMVAAARDVLLLEAGIVATREADRATGRVAEILHGALRLLAAAVAGS